jgi:hypothetical protein
MLDLLIAPQTRLASYNSLSGPAKKESRAFLLGKLTMDEYCLHELCGCSVRAYLPCELHPYARERTASI